MHIEITFAALTILALVTFAGAFIFAALTSDLTGSDVALPAARPFVLARPAAEYQLLVSRLLAPVPGVHAPATSTGNGLADELDARISLPRIETAAEVLETRTAAVQASAARVHGRPVIQALKMTAPGEWTLTFVPAC